MTIVYFPIQTETEEVRGDVVPAGAVVTTSHGIATEEAIHGPRSADIWKGRAWVAKIICSPNSLIPMRRDAFRFRLKVDVKIAEVREIDMDEVVAASMERQLGKDARSHLIDDLIDDWQKHYFLRLQREREAALDELTKILPGEEPLE